MMAEHENIKLDNLLCFALYAATHALIRSYRSGLDAAGITYTQYLVLVVLWENDNMPVGKIAEKLELDSATLTPLLKKLELAGFVSRTRNKLDERVVEIKLTSAGKKLQQSIAKLQNDVSNNTGLALAESDTLKSRLHDLVSTLNKA